MDRQLSANRSHSQDTAEVSALIRNALNVTVQRQLVVVVLTGPATNLAKALDLPE